MSLFLLLLSSFSLAANFLDNALSIGYYKVGSSDVTTLAWHPDFGFRALKLGFDVNVPLGQDKPFGYDNIVFRYAEYNDGEKGLRYGGLNNVTFAHGLLVKNYSTTVASTLLPTNQQMALMGFINKDRVKVQALGTWSHVYGLRLTETVHPLLILGQSYMTDTDGPNIINSSGIGTQYPPVSGYSADLSIPLPLNLEGYAEVAQLVNHGTGLTYGLGWGFDALVFAMSFDAGYRAMDRGFAPGYFNAEYESNPINLASYEASSVNKNGYILEFKTLAGEFFNLDVAYENYNNSNAAFNGNAMIGLPGIILKGYYTQPNFVDFRSLDLKEGSIVGGSIAYKVNPFAWLVVNYKQYYDPNLGRVIDTQYYEFKATI